MICDTVYIVIQLLRTEINSHMCINIIYVYVLQINTNICIQRNLKSIYLYVIYRFTKYECLDRDTYSSQNTNYKFLWTMQMRLLVRIFFNNNLLARNKCAYIIVLFIYTFIQQFLFHFFLITNTEEDLLCTVVEHLVHILYINIACMFK